MTHIYDIYDMMVKTVRLIGESGVTEPSTKRKHSEAKAVATSKGA